MPFRLPSLVTLALIDAEIAGRGRICPPPFPGRVILRLFPVRVLKTASVAVLKSTEHDVTLTSFVADLSYLGLSTFYIMCEIDAREDVESLALILAFV